MYKTYEDGYYWITKDHRTGRTDQLCNIKLNSYKIFHATGERERDTRIREIYKGQDQWNTYYARFIEERYRIIDVDGNISYSTWSIVPGSISIYSVARQAFYNRDGYGCTIA